MSEKNDHQVNNLAQIIENLSAKGIASAVSALFFAWIEAPPHAKGLSQVCKNLQRILPKVEAIARSTPQNLKTLISNLPVWMQIADDLAGPSDQVKTSLVGDYTGPYALYAALWHVPTKPDLLEKHSTLMAVLCVAGAKLHVLEARGASYKSSRYNAALYSRKLTKPKYEGELKSLPSQVQTLEEYLPLLSKDVPGQRSVWKFLDYAVGEKSGIRRTSSTRSAAGSVLSEDPPEPDDDLEIQAVQRVQLPQNKLKIKKIRKSLASPVEFSEGRERARITTKQTTTAREDVFYARTLGKRLAVQNQLLPTRWYLHSTHEVACFLDALEDLCKTPKIGKISGLELAAFLSVVFWVSTRPEIACNFRLYGDSPQESDGNGYVAARGRPPRPYWVIFPPKPKGYENPPRRNFMAHDAERSLYLPVPEPAQAIMSRYLDSLPDHSGKMFGRDNQAYLRAMSEFFTVFRKSRTRITPAMLSDHVFEKIMHAPGSDLVTAMLTTGRGHFLGFVPLHYTSVKISSLQKRYADVCGEITLNKNAESAQLPAVECGRAEGGADNKRTGSRYCPKSDTVKNLVARLHELLLDGQRGDLTDRTTLLRLHNRMVVYTTLMIGFATGYRSVVDPFLEKAVIDRASGFVAISDKDNKRYSHSRIIWVPEMVLQQLDYYHRHLKDLARRLLVANRKLHFRIRNKMDETKLHPVLFFIPKNMREIPVHQKILEDLNEYRLNCTIPSNANRHYLRTNLLESGCPIDIVDAFMGHWGHGTSAWGRFSALSPERYKACLKTYLLPILEQDGWRAMPGLGADRD